ncbi:phytanoyl-CoA dioxygenase family protein [Pseudovirgaria hyperparasitica]|uniref:Phytanoyl-CoA dioxygenase family protein n=1 Tax=Pseudovirgaria hyperparasitica TaxID=470096 RepID=A0A6A6VZU1_9PEZI|nr:phytanoyl-CoA dioxygenase family protein [Pseudovirgaria hyperparasitica]KAF2756188.1 phytanoyl-CoA dioxygenase family protein [Pseudovirgaria hyperparasitica]
MTATPPPPPTTDILAALNRDGFVVIPNVLSQDELANLRAASTHIAAQTRAGKWPYMRTLPKQFPPWPSDPSRGIWGVQHLLHPSMPHGSTFAASYFHPTIAAVVRTLLDCTDDDLIMELYNLLVRPDEDFALRWHRDDIPPAATADEELARLNEPAWHAQWNLALYEDSSLIVVPGSHRRARTQVERDADPYEGSLEGQRVVSMQPGDAVFYNNNILHRGVYVSSKERMTLHGSMGHVKGSRHRARNVLQHGCGEWVDECDFGGLEEGISKRAELMREKLVVLGREGGEVGFSQDD